MKLLIVDDNPGMRQLIGSIVADLAEIFECENASEALALYERHNPDWVFMDISMPVVNGIEATQMIKSRHSEAQVVIVTDFDDQRLRKNAHTAGACGYVLKEDLMALRRILTAAVNEAGSKNR